MREDAIKKILPWVVIFAAAVMIVAVPSPRTAKDSTSNMKQLMGENFENLQLILSNLIAFDYGNLRERIKTINEHALELEKFPRGIVKSEFNRRRFVGYACGLESHSRNLLTVLEELIKHDKQQSQAGMMNIDHLRVVAAQHFGQIVTTRVLCHNQVRRHMVTR